MIVYRLWQLGYDNWLLVPLVKDFWQKVQGCICWTWWWRQKVNGLRGKRLKASGSFWWLGWCGMVCVATAGVVCYLSCGGFTGCDGSIGIIVWRSALFWGSIRLPVMQWPQPASWSNEDPLEWWFYFVRLSECKWRCEAVYEKLVGQVWTDWGFD